MRDIAHLLRPAHLQQLRSILDDPEASAERPVRRLRPAEERLHRGGRRAADVPGHRHRDRDGQARPAGAHRRARRGAHRARRLRRLHAAEPALLAARPADHVGGAQHRHQPARADRAVRHRGRRVQVPVHGQGRRLGQQVLPLPGDQGGAEPGRDAGVPGGEDPLARHRRVPALPPGHRDRRHQRRVRAEDRQVRVGEVPRHAADRGLRGRARVPRHRAGAAGAGDHPAVRHRRAVRRQVLLPRRAGDPAAPARRLLPGGDRGVLLGRPPGARQDHPGRRVPRAARDRPGAVPARPGRARSSTTTWSGSTCPGRWTRSAPSCPGTRSRPGSRCPARWSSPATSPTPRSPSGWPRASRCPATCATTPSTTPGRPRPRRATRPGRSGRPPPGGWTPTWSSSRRRAARW